MEASVVILRPHGQIEVTHTPAGWVWRAEWWHPSLRYKQNYSSTRVYCAQQDAISVAKRWYGHCVVEPRQKMLSLAGD